MKKIALYSILALAGMALAACNEDFKDWAEPASPADPGVTTISFTPSAVPALDLRGMTADSVVAFNPNLAVSPGEAATTFDAVIYNAAKTDSVTIKANEQGRVRRSELQGAIIALFGNIEQARQTTMNITAYSLINGLMCVNHAYDVAVTVTPQQQELPPVWYIIGNCIGRGSWVNHATMGLYTSTVAMYVNPLNYEELVYASYFCDNAELKIILKAGDKEHFIGSAGNARDADQGNYTIAQGGYYKIIVNTKDTTLRYEPITDPVTVFTSMAMSNGSQLSVITNHPSGENHDWLGDLVVDTDAPAGEGVKFVADDGTTWGGNDFPAGKAVVDGANIPYKSGNYKVVFNDLLRTFRFIQK